MPAGYTMTFQKGEYPQIEGLGENAQIKFTGSGRVSENGNEVTLDIESMEFETEGLADREYKSMTKQESIMPEEKTMEGGEF